MINIPPQIKKDIDDINAVAKDLQMKLYVVGGFSRDLVSGHGITDDTDLDVTEANGNAFDLAFFVAAKYGLSDPVVYESSGTALVTLSSGRPVEFHNAFHNVPHIIDQLYSMGIEPTPLNKDIYSRDFTINTLLFDPDSGEIIDITGKGISDIEDKILRTPISPKKTLARSPKNILRGIRFAVQFGLEPDKEYERQVAVFLPFVKQFMKENPNSEMVRRTVEKTIKADSKKAYDLFNKYGLIEYLPPIPEVQSQTKKDLFGVEISPVAMKEAQTRMMDHLMEEREKHKAYMRRKKREQTQTTKKKFKILDRARSGYYLENDEPDFLKQRKIDKKNKILNLVQNNQASHSAWYKQAQEDVGLEGEGGGAPSEIMRQTDDNLGQDTDMNDPKNIFIRDFAEQEGIDIEVSKQTFKYIVSGEYLNDTNQVAQDSGNIVEIISQPMYSLPLENQTAIGELQDVKRIFETNRMLMGRMMVFEDSNKMTLEDISNPQSSGISIDQPRY